MPHSIFASLFSILMLLFSMHVSAKDVRYVSDDLTIPMRTGTTTNHKILKFLNSGMAVEVIEEVEDGQYARVVLRDDDDKTGWVKTELLMNQPSARDQLTQLKRNISPRLISRMN